MEIILPPELHSDKKFVECALQIRYDEFTAKQFAFYNSSSDVDVYELSGDERLQALLYGWEVCSLHCREAINSEMCHVVKVLAHHSLQLWFSQEWMICSSSLKRMLLHFLQKAAKAFAKIEVLSEIDWSYLLRFKEHPWRLPYLQQLFSQLKQNKQQAIEHSVPVADAQDISFLKQESLHLILLRLIKLFDAGSYEAVKQLALRVLAAWLKCHATASLESLQSQQASITLVGHLYLLTVFVADDNHGYKIDNMMYNIRFYSQSMQEAPSEEDIAYTPARLIAKMCVRLQLGKYGFFEQIMFRRFSLSLVTPFAVILEAYTSYVLGNQLLELMSMNEHDFAANLSQFKVLMHRYVDERENSEQFLMNELKKLEAQRNSHALPNTMKLNLNYQQQICKGNRASNIGNYKNCDDDEKPLLELDEERDRQIDPVFQNVPDNNEVLEFVYNLLAERTYSGWQFAKIVLLVKLIGHKLNTIGIWRYHPGLTTQFMINLEHKLSDNYADLAKVFSEYGFMEAEFWVTAFYLHPIAAYYAEVKRCSRIKKKRKEDDDQPSPASKLATSIIKFELLSSTIDVDEIVAVTNHTESVSDYEPIYNALQALRLPRSLIKDLLSVAFQPRNKRYSWALDWSILHERCSALLKSRDLKSKFVALDMAEANDQLKFLNVDYAKYKDRPQLDYGSIEEGYENAANAAEAEMELSPDEDEPTEAEKAAEAIEDKKRSKNKRKYWDDVFSEEEEEEDFPADSDDSDDYCAGNGRRKRVRAAAMVANAMMSDMDRAMRSTRRSPPPAEVSLSTPSPAPAESESEPESEAQSEPESKPVVKIEARPFVELLEAHSKYSNETSGFNAFADIWSFDKEELLDVENDDDVVMQSNSLLAKFSRLKGYPEPAKKPALPLELKQELKPEKLGLEKQLKLEPIEPVRSCSPLNHADADADTDSMQSATSTMAIHDSNEFGEEQLEALVEMPSEKATPPPPPPPELPDLAMEQPNKAQMELQMPLAMELDVNAASGSAESAGSTEKKEPEPVSKKIKKIKTRDDTQEDLRSATRPINKEMGEGVASEVKEADETARLIQECLNRAAFVRLEMLTPLDIEQLRGFRVRVRRTNFNDYYRQLRQSRESRRRPSPAYEISEQQLFKKIMHITSDSVAATPTATPTPVALIVNKQIVTQPFRHITSDSSTEPEEAVATKQRRKVSQKMRIAPRSSSGLKVRIVTQRKPERHSPDIIELSSGSSSSSCSQSTLASGHFAQLPLPLELDPLYEEEIVPY